MGFNSGFKRLILISGVILHFGYLCVVVLSCILPMNHAPKANIYYTVMLVYDLLTTQQPTHLSLLPWSVLRCSLWYNYVIITALSYQEETPCLTRGVSGIQLYWLQLGGCLGASHASINHLKTKRRLLYLKTQSVPRCKHFSSRL